MRALKENHIGKMNLEKVIKVVTYALVFAFKLRHQRLSTRMQLLISGCHFLRQIRQFVSRVTAEVHECPLELMKRVLKYHGALEPNIDFGNLLVCGSEFFPKFLKNFRWGLVEADVTRWVLIISLPIKGMGNKCFGSQQLIFNLFGRASKNKQLIALLYPETLREICSCNATVARIALINSQSSNSDVSNKLKEYFSISRYVQVDDLISVDDNTTVLIKSIEFPQSKPKNLGFFVEQGITTLYQVTSISSLRLPSYFKLKNNQSTGPFDCYDQIINCFIPCKPYGLSEECQKMYETIAPFLSSSDLSTLPCPSFLISGISGSGKRTVVKSVANMLGLHFIETSCLSLLGESAKATELRLKNAIQGAHQISPAILYLTDLEVIGKAREGHTPDHRLSRFFVNQMRQIGHPEPLFIVGACQNDNQCSADVYGALLHKIVIDTSTSPKRMAMLRWILEENDLTTDTPLDVLGRLCHGFHFGDLNAVVSLSVRHAGANLKSTGKSFGILPKSSLDHAINVVRQWQSQSMNAPSIPEVRWEDVGGLQNVISELLDTIQLPLKYPELVDSGLKRSGILLYGPPGTGKTLLAKAVATECSLHFLSVKGPELLNMYVGQSEENVRNVFEAARRASPCLIFFDELDSLAPNRGRSGDSGGVMDRVVSQLLAELDGINKSAVVFVIGATNRPDLIDPALLRPGRFDKLLYLGVNDSKDNQLAVLKALTRKFRLDPDVDLEEVVRQLPPCLTGADMYSFCSDAVLSNVARIIRRMKEGHAIDSAEHMLSAADFREAAERLVPSVSPQDLLSYQRLQHEINKSSSG